MSERDRPTPRDASLHDHGPGGNPDRPDHAKGPTRLTRDQRRAIFGQLIDMGWREDGEAVESPSGDLWLGPSHLEGRDPFDVRRLFVRRRARVQRAAAPPHAERRAHEHQQVLDALDAVSPPPRTWRLDQPDLPDQVLWVEGRASEDARRALTGVAPEAISGRPLWFLSFAGADVPVGTVLPWAFPEGDPQTATRLDARLVFVTQQFARPWTEIPHGWKTLCAFELPRGEGPLADLPTVDGWYEGGRKVGLCLDITIRRLHGKRT